MPSFSDLLNRPLSFRRASEARQEESAEAGGAPFLASFARKLALSEAEGWGFLFESEKNLARYFFLFLRTGFRKISQASRYFSYFDRIFRLFGESFSAFNPSTTRTGSTYHAPSGFA